MEKEQIPISEQMLEKTYLFERDNEIKNQFKLNDDHIKVSIWKKKLTENHTLRIIHSKGLNFPQISNPLNQVQYLVAINSEEQLKQVLEFAENSSLSMVNIDKINQIKTGDYSDFVNIADENNLQTLLDFLKGVGV